ncbi:MAG: tetratricopeptide repeat protein [Silvibacterium sp.]|nr:tetratricopeptide repeat protein [Silvibacterium sp.]
MGDSLLGAQPLLEAGYILGARYEILALLGEGGMGAVYKARDIELNRTIALKTIRREYAGNPAIIDRFKQELILSTQVTHRNVVRIYDLGEADGMKFITMEYIDGADLRNLIHKRKKLPADDVVEIISQVCKALQAAHNVGVIHRDLKPQNIMREEPSGRIVVMDFGLARTLEGDGMTQTGALVGTMEYMSPEQALGKPLDQRSDVFSLGLIFYELLTGEAPFRADSALASLIKRTQERPVPVTHHDSTISGPIDRIVSRCLERDVNLRYQTADELLTDLNKWRGKTSSGAIPVAPRGFPSPAQGWLKKNRWLLAGGGVAAVVLVVAGYVATHLSPSNSGARTATNVPAPISLAILPFRNTSGNESDDWMGSSIADMLTTTIGQSAHLRAVPSDRLQQVLSDLRIGPQSVIDPDTLRRIAEFSNAGIVVSGQFSRFGDQIVIDGTIRDLKHDQTKSIKAQAAAKDLPSAIDSLAESVRESLALSPDVVKELKAQSYKPNSSSVEALRAYNEGLVLMREGKNLDALKRFQSAVTEDAQFALAHARLAEVQSDLGLAGDAEQSSRRAVELAHSENLPLPEQYLIDASHARITKNNKEAIDAYQNLAASWPSDVDVQYNLGTLYMATGDYSKAHDIFAKILAADPRNIKALWEMGVVEFTLGRPQDALDYLSKGLNLATQVDNQEQKALILLSTGICYRLLNKPDEAMRNYQESIAINEKIGQRRGVAAALDEVANMQAMSGKSDEALATYEKALGILREIGMREEQGDTLLEMGTVYQDRGDYDEALSRYKEALEIQREIGNHGSEALCMTNIASVYLAKGDTDSSFTYFQQALQIREQLGVQADIAPPLEGLGEAYTHTGQYNQALSSLMKALDLARKANDARSIALISHQIGLVLEYQGYVGRAIKSMQDGVKAFREQGEHGNAMATFLTDLAGAFARAGRGEEAGKPLDEAEGIVRDLKNNGLAASIANTRGDVAFYRGDLKTADQFYQSAVRLTARTRDNDVIVQSKLNVAKVAIAQDRAKDALAILRPMLKPNSAVSSYLTVRVAITNAEAEIGVKDLSHAEHELNLSLTATEKAGMRLDIARIYYLLGETARLSGTGEHAQIAYYYREAVRLLEAVKAEPGAEKVLTRSDLKAMYENANQWK